MLSVITVIGLIFAVLLGQTAITEAIFTIPGIGQLILRGVSNRDYALIQGSLIMVGGAYVLINLLIDLTYGLIDPRITYK
jgi:peptide/nickel transport system permease protein